MHPNLFRCIAPSPQFFCYQRNPESATQKVPCTRSGLIAHCEGTMLANSWQRGDLLAGGS
jgi:hypothetical protein